MSPGIGSALGRRAVVWSAVVALVIAGSAMPVGSAGAVTGDATASTAVVTGAAEQPTLAVRVERSGSTVRYKATVRAPEAADRVRLDGAFGILNVTASDGFVAAGNGYRLRDGRERATLTASIDLSDQQATPLGRVGSGGTFQAGTDWAFAPSPRYHVRWWTDGSVNSTTLREAQTRDGATRSVVVADSPVAVGERFVFLGPHSVRREQVEGRTVRLIVPDGAAFDTGAERSFELARSVQQEAGTSPDGPVTAFVLPRTVRAGGGASGADLWLRADVGELTVAHEFAHTALSLPTTEEVPWLSEAAAEYLAYQTTHEGDVTATLRERVNDGDAVLAERASWESSHVAYRKGAALLALLDDRIADATDGAQSLTAVLARLSAGDEPIDAAALGNAVSAVADERTATWLDEQATSTTPATLPENRAAGFVATDMFDGESSDGAVVAGIPVSLGNLSASLAVLGALSMLVWRAGHHLYRRVASRAVAT
ncbi:MAG: hypothetical protein ABEH90_05505 [Halolamina sp.]